MRENPPFLHKRYKLRRLNPGNMTGDSYGITVPLAIALKYRQVPFFIYESGTGIVLDMKDRRID